MAPDPHKEFIQRGSYAFNPLGIATFVGLRAIDPFLQFQILTHSTALVTKLGLRALPSLGGFGITPLTSLPLPSQLILFMAAGSSIKQIIWALYLSKEEMIPSMAIKVAVFNTVINSINSLLFVTAASSAVLSGPQVPVPFTSETVSLPVAIGAVAYAVGIVAETVAEVQRKRFKDDPANKGKVCNTGLWSWARHANYGAYTIWRAGYSLAAGSWPAAAAVAAFLLGGFVSNSIPELDDYMKGRYSVVWEKYKKDVPYKLFPGIY
ncbi:hypothetical protein GE09DRAFT_663572 [Coniochaeta sp. 2T2.1]|nr:hypothetical protein GE09DRAFT_663572 [Coniochaeta sp. 2T2.1]